MRPTCMITSIGLKHPTINAERKHSKLVMRFRQILPFPTPLPGDNKNKCQIKVWIQTQRGKDRRLSYCKHRPECSCQFTENAGGRFQTQESQHCEINAVPSCCPQSLVKGYFGRNHPPMLEGKKLLQNSKLTE